jgi:hypothetical protein
MSERTRPLTDQEMDQALRVEEMRKYREQAASGGETRAPDAPQSGDSEAPAGLAPLDKPSDDIYEMFDEGPPVPLPRLADQPALPPSASDTETQLNGLIEECRFLLREVAFNSARLTPNVDDRIRFLSSAESLAITGAKIADTVVRLRAGSSAEERRHRVIYEHAQTPSLPLPPVKSSKNEKQ